MVVVDYGRSNLFSLTQALRHLGAEFQVSGDPHVVEVAGRIVLPGVGAFGDGMANLRERGLDRVLRRCAQVGTPIIGICLGMQLLATRSLEFGNHEGLDLIDGTVRRLPEGDQTRIPNVGWRQLDVRRRHPLVDRLPDNGMVYFVHSYHLDPDDPTDVVATTAVNGCAAAAIVQRGNLFGMQFHPEKSGLVGLDLIRSFLEISA